MHKDMAKSKGKEYLHLCTVGVVQTCHNFFNLVFLMPLLNLLIAISVHRLFHRHSHLKVEASI